MRETIRTHPLGLLITVGPTGPTANLLPFDLHESQGEDHLRAHLASANPQVADLVDGRDALVVFQGPQAYVSPSWYPSKQINPKVVPTWNYIMVQARCRPCVVTEAEWLRSHVERLTDTHEQASDSTWRISDAPDSHVSAQLRHITGVELRILGLQGKWKVSQNRSEADQAGVRAALKSRAADLADAMAARSHPV